ncbi:hypothetical protein OS493_004569 [Desmophyllum pertusum]|uniref:Uncharacterized protein n=1 Tax=Desmophyllum pertusum TaxID=174260 RepID=A0A9W9ZG99_9CNID|nr:hypothetical protein OS493_004569 [Desmophyllum pertusum]
MAAHKSANAKGSHRMNSRQSAYILQNTKSLIPVGASICKQCKEFVSLDIPQPPVRKRAPLHGPSKGLRQAYRLLYGGNYWKDVLAICRACVGLHSEFYASKATTGDIGVGSDLLFPLD